MKYLIFFSDLIKVGKLLKYFCIRVEELYGSRYEIYNIYCLFYFVDRVKDFGFFWIYLCFCFEDYNGEFRYFFYGI